MHTLNRNKWKIIGALCGTILFPFLSVLLNALYNFLA